jgi:hypothetical protein
MGYPKQKRRPEPSAAGAAEIRVQAPPERLAAARFAHARLLKAIAAKKKSLDKLDARIDETAQRMATLAPLRDRLVALDGEVHALFQTLLARKQLPRDERRALATVHAFLIRAGVLAPPGWSASEAKQTFAGERETDAPPDGGGFSARRPSDAPQDHEGSFARLRGPRSGPPADPRTAMVARGRRHRRRARRGGARV